MTAWKKRRVVEEGAWTLVEALGKRPEHPRVILDEVEPDPLKGAAASGCTAVSRRP